MRRAGWLRIAGFCVLLLAGKLWFLHVAGSDLPTWDQWDAEGEVVLRPWLEGWMRAKEIFHPHNEHRLVTTKLYALGLFLANGQWDASVETVANAVIHLASALVLLLLARRWLPPGWLPAFAALLAALFVLPFSWENALFGFQVQFYFLLLFSLGHLALTLDGDHFSGRWFFGQLSAVLAVLSLASGFFSSAALLAVLAHRAVRERQLTAQQITSAVLALGGCVAGWLMKHDVPEHAALHAHGVGQFFQGFLELLAWPGTALFPWSLILLVPAAVFTDRCIRRQTTSRDEALLLGLFIWLLLQCAATAYARGGSGAVLSPRYLDLLAVNVVLGFVFLVREFSGRRRLVLAGVWLAAMTAGLVEQSRFMWRDFVAPNISRQEIQQDNVRAYLRTKDPSYLLNRPWGEVPYPVGEVLLQRLSSPLIQDIMPPSVRRSLPVASAGPVDVPSMPHPAQRPIAWSSWSARGSHWTSAHQPPARTPYFRLTVAGDLGAAGRLTVKSATDEIAVVPDSPPGLRWKTVNIPAPAGEWWIEADSSDAATWFAFTEPVEVARWSLVAGKLIKHFLLIGTLGAALLALGSIPLLRRPAA